MKLLLHQKADFGHCDFFNDGNHIRVTLVAGLGGWFALLQHAVHRHSFDHCLGPCEIDNFLMDVRGCRRADRDLSRDHVVDDDLRALLCESDGLHRSRLN